MPSADPMANTSCPILASAVEPRVKVRCSLLAPEIFRIATSTSAAVDSTRAGIVSPDIRRIDTVLFRPTTCTLVSSVSGATKNPVPRLPDASTITTAVRTPLNTSSRRRAACGSARFSRKIEGVGTIGFGVARAIIVEADSDGLGAGDGGGMRRLSTAGSAGGGGATEAAGSTARSGDPSRNQRAPNATPPNVAMTTAADQIIADDAPRGAGANS